jgi:hypothetical protein
MQECFAFLLRVKTALVEFHAQSKDDPAFPAGLKVLGDMSFWERLKNAKLVIRPLSFASYKLQRDENTVTDVFWSTALAGYFPGSLKVKITQMPLTCVEKRWFACEQSIFILGYFLHPAYFLTRPSDAKNIAHELIQYGPTYLLLPPPSLKIEAQDCGRRLL